MIDQGAIVSAAHRQRRATTTLRALGSVNPDVWLANALRLEPAIEKLEARGGKVVFVRWPTSGEHWQLDREYFPREKFWDRLAESTSALTIHFQDYATLRGFECPDTSHLDYVQAHLFTSALAEILVEKGVLRK